MAPTTQTEDTRDGSTLVAVVHKSHLDGGKLKDDIDVRPGLVSLRWLRIGDNADNWIEIDQQTGKKVTPAQAAKAAAVAGQEG